MFQDKPEMFVNVNELSIVNKQIRPIVEQDSNESRKLWKEVTRGLKFNEIEKASNAKAEIEQTQREEAKERKVNNVDWETKVIFFSSQVLLFTIYVFSCFKNKQKTVGCIKGLCG